MRRRHARSRNHSHERGRLIHYGDDPGLADLVWRSTADFSTSFVVSTCSLRRSQLFGSPGAGLRFLSRHHVSHELTAARLRFHVDSRSPSLSTTSPISTLAKTSSS